MNIDLASPTFLLAVLAGLALLLALWTGIALLRLQRRVDHLQEAVGQRDQQLQLLRESLQGMGQQLLAQQDRLRQQASSPGGSRASSTESTSPDILRQLEAGKSVAEIASETGLQEVEISLLKQIHGASHN